MPRAETLLIDYLGAEDTELTRNITKKFLAAAVARVYKPGIKFDYVTVLQGREGIGKSTIIAKLAGAEWFNESMTDIGSKDAMEAMQGSWLIELGELQAIKRSEVEATKAFISRQTDTFRPAYGRVRESHPRQCIFFATTNEDKFLKGYDGNRRFWIVACNGDAQKDVFAIDDALRDQIWAEAVQMFKNGEALYLDCAQEAAARKMQKSYNINEYDVRIGMIESYLNKMLPVDWNTMDINSRTVYLADTDDIERRGTHKRDKVCVAEIMVECFHERLDDKTPYKSREYAALMKQIDGWELSDKVMRFKHYGTQRGYIRIEENEDDI